MGGRGLDQRFHLSVLTVTLLVYVVQVELADTDIYSLHITSDISYRFATTTVRSQVANARTEASEINFNVQLPKAAFIANFSMEIDGVVYPGDVKEKEQARQQYERAKQQGQSAGHVAASPRNTNKFKVSVNVAAQSKVTFELLYQELLERRLGSYNHVININPGQVVRDMQITVNVHESREITFLKVPPIREEIQNTIPTDTENEIAEIRRAFPNRATVTYAPTEDQQRNASALGVSGQFIVQYDVARGRDAGEIQVVDGYFVHFIAPRDVQVGDKAILFILDVSGSMSGNKIAQVHEAMESILSQLRPGDYFNMLKFSGDIGFWQNKLVSATEDNKQKGTQWAQQLQATGSTNINLAVTEGIRRVARDVRELSEDREKPLSPLIIFLTDGLPSEGEQNLDKINDNVKRTNEDRVTLFSLGFGNDVDFSFLKKMALQNKGFGRKIYADSDAALQLDGFYQEVASPILSDVTVEYLNNAANNSTLTKNTFHTYFLGTEMIVAGSLNDVNTIELIARISGNSAEGPLVFNMVAPVDGATGGIEAPSAAGLQNNIERMWAYLTIKEILERRLESDDKDEKDRLKQRALDMSLRYHFVTPVTSMVVTKPDEPPVNEEVREDGDRDEQRIIPGAQPPPTGRQHGYPAPGPAGLPGLPGAAPPIQHSLPSRNYRGFVDNDPHFVVNVDGSALPVCFDVMGKIGEIYQLLHDPELNLTLNGLVVGKAAQKKRTYLGEIGITANGTAAVLSPRSITVNGRARKWSKRNTSFRSGALSFQFESKHLVKVSAGDHVTFAIMRHMTNKPDKVDFMGIYTEKDEGLSSDPYGLLGQFKDLRVDIQVSQNRKGRTSGVMTFPQFHNRKSVRVFRGKRRNLASKQHMECWYVRNNGNGLLEGKVQNYRVPNMLYNQLAGGLAKRFTI